ncbi:Beta-Alanine-Activating Enzyme [Manis pentadactyla]|nr:Beta-Alanine-Activating Enzyme [Manis pentadactyla]
MSSLSCGYGGFEMQNFTDDSHAEKEGLEVLIPLGCGQITLLAVTERDNWNHCCSTCPRDAVRQGFSGRHHC